MESDGRGFLRTVRLGRELLPLSCGIGWILVTLQDS